MSKRNRKGASARRSTSGILLRWAGATALIAGFGFAGLTAAKHITTGNEKMVRAEPGSVWRPQAAAGASSQYLFSSSLTFTPVAAQGTTETPFATAAVDPFEAVKKNAKMTPQKLAKIFKREAAHNSQVAMKQAPAKKGAASFDLVATASVAPERFGSTHVTPKIKEQAAVFAMAYAPQQRSSAADALHSLAQEEAETDAGQEAVASLPPAADVLDPNAGLNNAPLPTARPDFKFKPAADVSANADTNSDEDINAGKPDVADEPAIAAKPSRDAKPTRMASAAPAPKDKASGGLGWSFRNLFTGGSSSGVRAGKGVAIYDISAAKVYMPDGSVLDAASGIGKMANNPKYVNVKMNGPTPPHTYNLKMREKRFHGVEAIRMLPVDGKNKYGRDGFLTHSQLLRGRPGQSHGCVAFKDYNKFLNAYKQGKVRQMVVVASGGRAAATRVASN